MLHCQSVKLRMHNVAAIDVDGLPGHLRCSCRGQKRHHVSNVLWLLPTAKRCDGPYLIASPVFVGTTLLRRLLIVPRLPDTLVEGRAHHTRAHNIDANSMRSQVLRHTLREVDVRCFTRAVRRG